ncbi:MAG: type II toxin-antitoxin system RelE/ParE family toxin, partial [Bacteroidota bacterium]
DTGGWVIRFKNELVPNSRFNFYSNFLDQINYKLNDDYCSTTLNSLCEIMLKEFEEESVNYQVIKHLLSALLTKLEADSKQEYLDGTAGLYEIRIISGNISYRIFCFFDSGTLVILLQGFMKKSMKTPKKEIRFAEKLMKEYLLTREL